LDVLTRSWTADEFRAYVEVLLMRMNPYPQSNLVLICDNASLHLFDGLREMVEARGFRLLYLPPYSPDFNPIEEGFSAMKAWI
jgi:transposase